MEFLNELDCTTTTNVGGSKIRIFTFLEISIKRLQNQHGLFLMTWKILDNEKK